MMDGNGGWRVVSKIAEENTQMCLIHSTSLKNGLSTAVNIQSIRVCASGILISSFVINPYEASEGRASRLYQVGAQSSSLESV